MHPRGLARILITIFILPVSGFAQSKPATMKAVVARQPGGPEVLLVDQVLRPEPNEGEVLVKVMAAGVNPVDAYIRAGKFKRAAAKVPMVLGMDIAGLVEKVGPKVSKFKVGDQVYSSLSVAEQGGYAE